MNLTSQIGRLAVIAAAAGAIALPALAQDGPVDVALKSVWAEPSPQLTSTAQDWESVAVSVNEPRLKGWATPWLAA